MKHQSYLNRAMASNDRRYARIFGKLGYETTAMTTDVPAPETDIDALRDEYQALFGKKPYHGWDADMLAQKIAARRVEA